MIAQWSSKPKEGAGDGEQQAPPPPAPETGAEGAHAVAAPPGQGEAYDPLADAPGGH